MTETSVYIHIPFCTHRCGYCDFNTYEGLAALIPAYVDAVVKEIRYVGERVLGPVVVQSIFLGGGTPSLLSAAQVEAILRAVGEAFLVLPGCEITLEANPGTVTSGYFRALRSLGVNRISMGVQSSRPQELTILEREHDFGAAIQAMKFCREAGFQNVSIDLIFGLPAQQLAHWQRVLEDGLALNPDHISLYALSIEHGTPMQRMFSRGLIEEIDQDAAADMYEWSMNRLAEAGFCHYEISNWAKRDEQNHLMASLHNLQYWRNQPYLGFGAGAHGYFANVRTVGVLAPGSYVARMRSLPVRERAIPRTPATAAAKAVDRQDEIGETMMMGLRLLEEGVSRPKFLARFDKDLDTAFPGVIRELEKQGLLEDDGERIRLSRRGRVLGNRVFVRFV
ncbi:MAG: radical SAM family heme chaperone HemW [Chloroflexi bacterium]|nr:radical SAM family heme chaperone HemW [Chloroflexota bacterium]